MKLIVGLGNQGSKYEGTRHNAGADLVSTLVKSKNLELKSEIKFFGSTAGLRFGDNDVRALIPETFMNLSGQSIAALSNYYRILPSQILVAHDDLDLPVGTARFKFGGGHGGHNGIRDVINKLGNNSDFGRIRIGIGHPGNASQVTEYVLAKAPTEEKLLHKMSIENALKWLPLVIGGEWGKAVTGLHSEPFSANMGTDHGI